MLKGITWTDYLTVAAVLVLAWYAVVAVLYYRKEIKVFFKGRYRLPGKNKASVTDEYAEEDGEGNSTFEELENIVTDIKHSILEKAGKDATKAALLSQLKARLANYGGLRQPAFRVALNNFITANAESICGVAFSEEELDEAWEALPR